MPRAETGISSPQAISDGSPAGFQKSLSPTASVILWGTRSGDEASSRCPHGFAWRRSAVRWVLRSHGQLPAHCFSATWTPGKDISYGDRDSFVVGAVTPVDARCCTSGVSPVVGLTLRHGVLHSSESRKRGTSDCETHHPSWTATHGHTNS